MTNDVVSIHICFRRTLDHLDKWTNIFGSKNSKNMIYNQDWYLCNIRFPWCHTSQIPDLNKYKFGHWRKFRHWKLLPVGKLIMFFHRYSNEKKFDMTIPSFDSDNIPFQDFYSHVSRSRGSKKSSIYTRKLFGEHQKLDLSDTHQTEQEILENIWGRICNRI